MALCSSICAGGVAWIAYRSWCISREREKPQRRFKVVYADNKDTAFPHLVGEENPGEENSVQGVLKHPYSHLLEGLKSECVIPLSEDGKVRIKDVESLPWKWIDTNDQLADLVALLQVCDEGDDEDGKYVIAHSTSRNNSF